MIPGLFIGSYYDLLQSDSLKQHNITHVLSVQNAGMVRLATLGREFNHLWIDADDFEDELLCLKFEEIVDFIKGGMENGRVFVHCVAGVSRSATSLSAYLIHEHGMSDKEAIATIKHVRSQVNPNSGFREQLEVFYLNDAKYFYDEADYLAAREKFLGRTESKL